MSARYAQLSATAWLIVYLVADGWLSVVAIVMAIGYALLTVLALVNAYLYLRTQDAWEETWHR